MNTNDSYKIQMLYLPVSCFLRDRACIREPGDVFTACLCESGEPFNGGDVLVSLGSADRRRIGPEKYK